MSARLVQLQLLYGHYSVALGTGLGLIREEIGADSARPGAGLSQTDLISSFL